MAIQTKSQLSASNNTAFPDNVDGLITPAILRGYNTASIDSFAALSGSNTFVGNQVITGSVFMQTASVDVLTVNTFISSSTIIVTGSNTLGDASIDTQTLWGTVNLPTGPLKVTGSVSATGGFTGSLEGTSSWANSSSYALVAQTATSVSSGSISYSGLTGWMDNLVTKTTGSFNIISGSYTKILSLSSSRDMAINMDTWCAISGAIPREIGYQGYGGYLRPNDPSAINAMTSGGSSQGLILPIFSASFNSGTGYVDVYARNSYGGVTSSVIITMNVASAAPITIA